MFPVNRVFDWDAWQDGYGDYWIAQGRVEKRELFKRFKDNILQNFKNYQVPVIALDSETSREAVCLVFEKVNTGGQAARRIRAGDCDVCCPRLSVAQGLVGRQYWLRPPEASLHFRASR